MIGFLTEACARHPARVLAATLLVVALSAWLVATRLGMNTGTEEMIAPDVPFRQAELAFDRTFPQFVDPLVVVIDAPDSQAAEDAADALLERLAARPDLFPHVGRPDGDPALRRSGLLFLPRDRLAATVDRLIRAQPFIAGLAADPSLRGLLATLDLFLDGIALGQAQLADLTPALAPLTGAFEEAAAGRPRPIAWGALFMGDSDADPRGPRRLILAQPALDLGSLAPGATATAAVREAARDLGLVPGAGYRVRLTGTVALADEELADVAEGSVTGLAVSFALVALILVVALRSWRPVVAVLVTLVAGLVVTLAFAAVAVGTLNLISVAFVIMFIGIAVDFGIQFAVRVMDERVREGALIGAIAAAGTGVGGAMVLAGFATAAGFLAFLPTDFEGVAELGLIAGAGMLIALVLYLTMLPALLAALGAGGRAEPAGLAWAAPIDRLLARHRRIVLALTAAVVAGSVAALPSLRFDFDPLHLKDPASESVATLHDLTDDPFASANAVNLLAPSLDEAVALAQRVGALPEVATTVTLASFVPEDQEAKLAILADAAFVLAPALDPPTVAPPPVAADLRAVIVLTAQHVREVAGASPEGEPALHFANALEALASQGDAALLDAAATLVSGLPQRLTALGTALAADGLALDTVPASLRGDWVAADGTARVLVLPKGALATPADMERFVDAVATVSGTGTGLPVAVVESSRVVLGAFAIASALALAAIVVMLALALRRPADVAYALAPVILAAVLTVAAAALAGLPITFANIIGLPLLLGIGVTFPIYLVARWRAGGDGLLSSGTARAVLFSALTTGAAFGALALSAHPGTADMGRLLLIALVALLVSNLVVLPALLAGARRA